MPGFFRRSASAISDGARKRIAALKPYPTLDTWRNPVTRGFARRLQNEEARRLLDEIDFEYRITSGAAGGVEGVFYETENAKDDAPIILFVHGGGFVAGGPKDNASSVLPICYLSGCNGFGPDYSLLPEAHYPTQIEEFSAVYHGLCGEHPGARFVVVAVSTGAAIALSAMMQWRDEGAPLPIGAVFLSPCVDGMGASDTQVSLAGRDPVIRSSRGAYIRNLFRYYAPGEALNNPAVSPLYGDFSGLPPMLAHAGGREVLMGDAARLVQAAGRVGVAARLQIYDGMYHRFHAHWSLDEARDAHREIAEFIQSL